jgi:hypothetical protein
VSTAIRRGVVGDEIAEKKTVTLAETDWVLRCSLASLANRHGAGYAWHLSRTWKPDSDPNFLETGRSLALVVP